MDFAACFDPMLTNSISSFKKQFHTTYDYLTMNNALRRLTISFGLTLAHLPFAFVWRHFSCLASQAAESTVAVVVASGCGPPVRIARTAPPLWRRIRAGRGTRRRPPSTCSRRRPERNCANARDGPQHGRSPTSGRTCRPLPLRPRWCPCLWILLRSTRQSCRRTPASCRRPSTRSRSSQPHQSRPESNTRRPSSTGR